MTAIKGIVALVLAGSWALAPAETIYKYERPDGKVIYSDSPVKGARLLGRFELVPAPASPAAGQGEPPRPSGATRDPADRRAQALEAADARIKAADQALTDALERQKQAQEPLPGERRGNVGGKSRLTPEYFSRQDAAAAEVDAARAGLEEAYRLRDQVRE